MSLDRYRKAVEQATKKRAAIEAALATERGKAAKLQNDIAKLIRSVTPRTSESLKRSKERQIASKRTALQKHQVEIGKLEKDLAKAVSVLHKTVSDLEGANDKEQKKQDTATKQRQGQELKHTKQVTQELKNQAAMYRQLGNSRYVIDLKKLPEQITVLFVTANFGEQAYLELDDEMRSIKQKVRASEYREAITFQICPAARAVDLIQALNEFKPHIIHFSGHGSEQGHLAFRRDDGSVHLVSPQAIAQTIKTAGNDDLCLALFNSCHSAAQAKAVVDHIPVSIGMGDSVRDDNAREFAAYFYGALGFGHSIAKAFGQAQTALVLQELEEEHVPQLFAASNVDPNLVVLVRPE